MTPNHALQRTRPSRLQVNALVAAVVANPEHRQSKLITTPA